MFRLSTLLIALILTAPLFSERPDCAHPQRIFGAFETTYLSRERAGGSWQEGLLFGGRIGWDRVKPSGFYWGIDSDYLTGTLMGVASNGLYAESRMQVAEVEGRLGWTFGWKCRFCPSFTPFIGYGYYNETNQFHANCPMQLRFRTSFRDIVLGFLTSVMIHNCFTLGLNAKVGFMDHGRNRISGDPANPPLSQTTGNRPQYTLELPLTLYPCKGKRRLEGAVIPFYRLRHFGGRENFPFDFFETQFGFYGVRFELALRL